MSTPTVDSKISKGAYGALIAIMLGTLLVLGVTFAVNGQRAGANPLPGDGDVTLESLNEGKKNEDNVQLRTGQVNKDTTGGGDPVSGRTSVVFASDAQPQSSFPACVDEVTVSITPVRNNSDPNNAPVIAQVSENSRDGFNIRLLNKEISGISDQNVRFTFIAYGVDRDADCGGEVSAPVEPPADPPATDPATSGLVPIGDVGEPRAYSADLAADQFCSVFILDGEQRHLLSEAGNQVKFGPFNNFTVTIPPADEELDLLLEEGTATPAFVEVECDVALTNSDDEPLVA